MQPERRGRGGRTRFVAAPLLAAGAATLLLVAPGPGASAGGPVTFERGPDRLVIQIEGKPFAVYAWGDPTIKRPYFAHVHAPSGAQVTRRLPPVEGEDDTDHATMHPGLWLAFGDLSGVDFWRNQGVVQHDGFVEAPVAEDQGGRFAVRNLYRADGKTICEEVRRIRIQVTPHGRLIDWQSEFRGPDAFWFGDQEEMGLGARMATNLTVTRGGAIIDGEGRRNEEQIWGKQADWCDYSGESGGIMMVPHPANVRRSWFHVRDYGLMVANPFGRQAFTKGEPSRIVVPRGTTLTLRFGALVHDAALDLQAAHRDVFARMTAPAERSSDR